MESRNQGDGGGVASLSSGRAGSQLVSAPLLSPVFFHNTHCCVFSHDVSVMLTVCVTSRNALWGFEKE